MVFFHVYILNVIALLLYVHYNNGPGDLVSGAGTPVPSVGGGDSSLPHPAPAPTELHVQDHSQSFSLPRIEGIRVREVASVQYKAVCHLHITDGKSPTVQCVTLV